MLNMQTWHIAPAVPQPLLSKPNWQKPVASQQPLHVVELQGCLAGPQPGASETSAPRREPRRNVEDIFMGRIFDPLGPLAKALRRRARTW